MSLRRWTIQADSPYALVLAADARLCRQNFLDDQVWELRLGQGDAPALAAQTQFGGRVGLSSVVPLFTIEGHLIYQALTYHQAPVITAFAPNYIRAEAEPLRGLSLLAEHLVFDSNAMGGLYRLSNTGDTPLNLRFELYGHSVIRDSEQKLHLISLADGGHALALGTFQDFAPLLFVEGGQAQFSGGSARPKIGLDLTLAAGASHTLRWLHVGLPDVREGIRWAQAYFKTDWAAFIAQIERAAEAIPQVYTGDEAIDLTLACAYNAALQAMFSSAGNRPYATLVTHRTPATGYSAAGNAQDYPRGWNGQEAYLSHELSIGLASIAPAMMQGALRNFLAYSDPTDAGWLDGYAGASPRFREYSAPPVLAQAAWQLAQQSADLAFAQAVYPSLLAAFQRWLSPKADSDGDGYPSWASEAQLNVPRLPMFRDAFVGQGLDIAYAETPSLAALLIAEGRALQQLAAFSGQDAQQLNDPLARLQSHLNAAWNGEYFVYRDRDTDQSHPRTDLLTDVPGDVPHFIQTSLPQASRLIVRISGGARLIPNISVQVDGLDASGRKHSETLPAEAFVWYAGRGFATTKHIFSQVDRIACEGLSRIYKVSAYTPDYTSEDINSVLPLLSGTLDEAQQSVLLKRLSDPARYGRRNGIPSAPATQAGYDPSGTKGPGAVWMWPNGRLVEALASFAPKAAAELMRKLLSASAELLASQHAFRLYLHADTPASGGTEHLAGLPPLAAFQRLIGVRILSSGRVQLHQDFAWGKAITLIQHGVTVKRGPKSLSIKFASGKSAKLPDAPGYVDGWTTIDDPKMQPSAPLEGIRIPLEIPPSAPAPAPKLPGEQSTRRVIIEVQRDE